MICHLRKFNLSYVGCRYSQLRILHQYVVSTRNNVVDARSLVHSRHETFLQKRQMGGLVDQFKTVMNPLIQKPVNITGLFQTRESDPTKHTMLQEGLYYTVSKEDHERFFPNGINSFYRSQVKTLNDFSIMARQPALEIIDLLNTWNFDNPMIKIILYGKRGQGKTMTMAHLLHYCGRKGFFILHVPWLKWWMQPKDPKDSKTFEGLTEISLEAVQFLSYILSLNEPLLNELTTSQKYEWTAHDSTEEGAPLSEIVQFGINRLKYSDEVVGALIKEIQKHAENDRLKILLAVDGINGIWKDSSVKQTFFRAKKVPTQQLTLVNFIKNLIQSDVKNSVMIASVNEEINNENERKSHYPFYLLGEQGSEFLEPFIPVEVKKYSDKEVYSCIEYYISQMWIQNPHARTEEGKKQLVFLSNKNPHQLMQMVKGL